jgi:hypothetical protein
MYGALVFTSKREIDNVLERHIMTGRHADPPYQKAA